MIKLGKKTDTTLKCIEGYNAGMAKPLLDKIFFADKVDGATVFIDYGCADGALIFFLSRIFPECYFIGYDESPEMMVAAAKRFRCLPLTDESEFRNGVSMGADKRIQFIPQWKGVQHALNNLKRHNVELKSCLILSSVVHEMYAYRRNIIDQLWQQIWDLNANYIALRDMMVSDTAARPSDSLSVARIRQRYEPEPLRAFESCWGSLNDNWSLTHFLLKYRYSGDTQWDRELHENYLPVSVERLCGLIPQSYEPIFMEHYTLPFLREQVWQDFGIQLQERTHLKMILKKGLSSQVSV